MSYDALVIGGGPGGSTAATFLAQAGKRVLVLERERFPRFHVGESLLPYNQEIFEEMGVLPALEAAGLIKKFGAQFHLGNGSKALLLKFRNGKFTKYPEAFQVERARFDHILLEHARGCGAEVREGWTVSKFSTDEHGASVQAQSGNGKTEEFRGQFLIDASGRSNFTGNKEGLRQIHPRLKKLAVFGHFEGVKLDEGEKGGDTVIVRLENKWFWFIPISMQKVSVGCVMDNDEFARAKAPPQEIFARLWKSSPAASARMQDAQLVSEMHTTSDFSYYNRRLTGPRLLRVGDAAGFMDPIFSAGVYLACYSGRLAAQTVAESIKAGNGGARQLKVYEKLVNRGLRYYWDMVEGFYSQPFIELFLEPREKFDLPSAITAILAGELHGGWRMWWRRKVFFWLVNMQAKWPLVPRIEFQENKQAGQVASSSAHPTQFPSAG